MRKLPPLSDSEKKYFEYCNFGSLLIGLLHLSIVLDKTVTTKVGILVSIALLPLYILAYSWAKRSAKLEELQRAKQSE